MFMLEIAAPIDWKSKTIFESTEGGHTQSAKFWKLAATTRLARQWYTLDQITDARDLLAPVYGWFTEGFDTADLKEAKSLLDELS